MASTRGVTPWVVFHVSCVASHDVVSNIYQALGQGGVAAEAHPQREPDTLAGTYTGPHFSST